MMVLTDLPPEILAIIDEYLDDRERCQLSQTCRFLRDNIFSYKRSVELTGEKSEKLLRLYTNLTSIVTNGFMPSVESVSHLTNLQKIVINNCCYINGDLLCKGCYLKQVELADFLLTCPLRSLHSKMPPLSDGHLREMLSLKSLESIEIQIPWYQLSQVNSNIETVHVTVQWKDCQRYQKASPNEIGLPEEIIINNHLTEEDGNLIRNSIQEISPYIDLSLDLVFCHLTKLKSVTLYCDHVTPNMLDILPRIGQLESTFLHYELPYNFNAETEPNGQLILKFLKGPWTEISCRCTNIISQLVTNLRLKRLHLYSHHSPEEMVDILRYLQTQRPTMKVCINSTTEMSVNDALDELMTEKTSDVTVSLWGRRFSGRPREYGKNINI